MFDRKLCTDLPAELDERIDSVVELFDIEVYI